MHRRQGVPSVCFNNLGGRRRGWSLARYVILPSRITIHDEECTADGLNDSCC
jgi:hypothetical protein